MPRRIIPPEEKATNSVIASPLEFAKKFLHDPQEVNKPFKPRWCQIEMMKPHKERLHTVRAQRRSGKTVCLMAIILWTAITKAYRRILVTAPYRIHVQRVFDELNKQIDLAPDLLSSVERRRQNPFEIMFDNGSIIRGIPCGVNTSRSGQQLRGEHPHLIYIDEADFLDDATWENFIPMITPSDPNLDPPTVWATTTPIGRQSFFYELCEKKGPKEKGQFWKNWWYPARHVPEVTFTGKYTTLPNGFVVPAADAKILCTGVNPTWDASQDMQQRGMLGQQGYLHEIIAWWGDSTSSVFPKTILDSAMAKGLKNKFSYITRREQGKGGLFTMGADIDKRQSTPHICLVEYVPQSETQFGGGTYIVRDTRVMERSDYIYHATRVELAKMIDTFRPTNVYIDKQPGDILTEELNREGYLQVKSKQFKESAEIVNPATNQIDNKPLKHVMINIAQRLFEAGRIILPPVSLNQEVEEEDGSKKKAKEPIWDDYLIGQLRNYQVVNVTKGGTPEYTAEDEHAVDAFLLAIWAAFENFDNPYELTLTNEIAQTRDLDEVFSKGHPIRVGTNYVPPEERFQRVSIEHGRNRFRKFDPEKDTRGFSNSGMSRNQRGSF